MSVGEDGETVVNVGHLMVYVDEQREEGNSLYKAGKRSEALAAWQCGLDAIAQADGLPMARVDVPTVVKARSLLHSNKGQALITMEFWRRAVQELDEAVSLDSTNAKAIWRRYQAHQKLKDWAAAQSDLEMLCEPELHEAAGPLLTSAGLGPEALQAERERLKQQRDEADRVAAETFEERAEDMAAKSIEQLRERFQEVTRRNGLHGNQELAAELADMVTRPGGVSVTHVAATYQIDVDDAEVLLRWTEKACAMRDVVGYQGVSL